MQQDAPFADIHSHVVPGVDDGTRTLRDSLGALRDFAAGGVGRLVTTPHFYPDPSRSLSDLQRVLDGHRRQFDELRAAWAREGGAVVVGLGQEIYAPGPEQLERALELEGVGLAGTGYLLVELGFERLRDPEGVIRAATEAGRRIVLAHPERYRFPGRAVDTVRPWVEAGAFVQLNLGGLLGHYLRERMHSRDIAWELLDAGLVHLLASDHHGEARPQVLHREAHATLGERLGPERADRLLIENPNRLLDGSPLLAVAPAETAPA